MSNRQQGYYPQVNSPSTTNLLPPSARGGQSSPSSAGSSPGPSPGLGPQANFARGPSLRSVGSKASLVESPYNVSAGPGRHTPSIVPSISDKFSLSADPAAWGSNISPNQAEPDDFLHNPDPKRDYKYDHNKNIFTGRGIANLGCLLFLGVGLVSLFAGYPLITYFTSKKLVLGGAYNWGGTNATGQVPVMAGNFALVDKDTPTDAYTHPVYNTAAGDQEMQLVFSDEFNVEGRSFYPGDDPYWEAADLHYWQTGNLEWYNPDAVTTKNGYLQFTFEEKVNHGLNYSGGLISTWNKFCFTGGMVVASVQLPGQSNVAGYWPAIWAMGNLGRAGYGASLDGMWPYTYDSCDVGTAPNQTHGGRPLQATTDGDQNQGGALSYLPGQRLSRCTCPGESHPGPVHSSDGSYVGRSSPEIDVFEAQVQYDIGAVSQSAQWAPFNDFWVWQNNSANLIIPDPDASTLNSYLGGVFQQASSVVTTTNESCYQLAPNPCFAVYGFEYAPGFDNAYISWIANDKLAWTLNAAGMGADTAVEIGPRPISQEPMYLIANLGMSPGFGAIDFTKLIFPATLLVDYIRVYQPKDSINIGCDPKDFPTAAYINQYIAAYTNPNLTTWTGDAAAGGYGQTFPKNKFVNGGTC